MHVCIIVVHLHYIPHATIGDADLYEYKYVHWQLILLAGTVSRMPPWWISSQKQNWTHGRVIQWGFSLCPLILAPCWLRRKVCFSTSDGCPRKQSLVADTEDSACLSLVKSVQLIYFAKSRLSQLWPYISSRYYFLLSNHCLCSLLFDVESKLMCLWNFGNVFWKFCYVSQCDFWFYSTNDPVLQLARAGESNEALIVSLQSFMAILLK